MAAWKTLPIIIAFLLITVAGLLKKNLTPTAFGEAKLVTLIAINPVTGCCAA